VPGVVPFCQKHFVVNNKIINHPRTTRPFWPSQAFEEKTFGVLRGTILSKYLDGVALTE
jgi:hypothetical protein